MKPEKSEKKPSISSSKDIVISLKKVSKSYKLYKSHHDRLKEALHPFGKKYHRDFYALKDINLEVRKGEILGIVGRNGSGKSTLLKLITGVLMPTSGEIEVKGRVSALLELGSGFNPNFTGRENVYFKGSLEGFSQKQMEEKIDEIIDFAEIGEYIDQPVKSYSSGMKARLAFAVSTAIEPEILILDEVLSVGDVLFRRKAFARMEKLIRNENTTVLFVSHDEQSIVQICSRALLLHHGKNILDDIPNNVNIYYQKLVFVKNKNSQDIVLHEIQELTRRKYQKENSAFRGEENISLDNFEGSKEKAHNPKQKFKPYFVRDFLPKSTCEYKNSDVDIFNVCIKTMNEENVNHLIRGEVYYFEYKVKFHVNAENVFFGMALKTGDGQTLTGANYPAYLKQVNVKLLKFRKNDTVTIRWKFRNILSDGTFFFNAGVSRVEFDKITFLNRIVDAIAIKNVVDPQCLSIGLIDMEQECKVIHE